MIATLTTLFGALGMVLSAVGLYGVTAYMAEQRTGAIGVRMALGADRGRVLRMALRGAFPQVAIGLAIGIPAAIRRRQADDAAIVQRKILGSSHASLGHVGVRPCSVARVGPARLARCGRGTNGGAAQRMRDGWLILAELTAGCPFRVIPAAGDTDFDHPTVRPAGWAVSIPLPAKFQSRPTTNHFRKPVPKGTEESRARHGSAGKGKQRKPSPL